MKAKDNKEKTVKGVVDYEALDFDIKKKSRILKGRKVVRKFKEL